MERLNTSDFDYHLPPEFIAQVPIEPRDASRLLVLNRSNGKISHHIFREIGNLLNPGDLLVLNRTRVIPARLIGRKIPGGGKIEFLLLRRQNPFTWEVLVGGKGLSVGKLVQIENGPQAEILAVLEGPRRIVQFEKPLESFLEQVGKVPLPPYIHTPLKDPDRYQTVFADQNGSAAAPTAGLHFTPQLIDELQHKGIRFAYVTLHIGLDTFAPVNETYPAEHKIHTEWCQLSDETAEEVNQTQHAGGRVIAVGTTSVRTLESAARSAERQNTPGIQSYEGFTDLFILPGYQFKAVDAMITNFHLPRSTLIMLVSAFAGRERILSVYQTAIDQNYRFYSFGDAMLIF